MLWFQIVVLAILQGLTEFLPISSSGHLILVPILTGWVDQGVAFDVAVHFGTLTAVMLYFRQDLAKLFAGAGPLLRGDHSGEQSSLLLALAIGTIPTALLALVMHDWISEHLRTAAIIAATTAGFGILLAIVDRYARRQRILSTLKLSDAAVIGLAQCLSLVPGTSRSGITITAGRALGFTRSEAARFSFLLSIPIILLAAAYETYQLVTSGAAFAPELIVMATGISAVVAYFTIGFFLSVVNRVGMMPFAVYRVLLGIAILYFLV
ncbi:MAG TPA: undecaprenyl-diphosphate phosphatase [Woeseiaceae bacterium]